MRLVERGEPSDYNLGITLTFTIYKARTALRAHGTLPPLWKATCPSSISLPNYEGIMRHVTLSNSHEHMYNYSSPCGLPSMTPHHLQGRNPCKAHFEASRHHEHSRYLNPAAGGALLRTSRFPTHSLYHSELQVCFSRDSSWKPDSCLTQAVSRSMHRHVH